MIQHSHSGYIAKENKIIFSKRKNESNFTHTEGVSDGLLFHHNHLRNISIVILLFFIFSLALLLVVPLTVFLAHPLGSVQAPNIVPDPRYSLNILFE